MRNVAELEARVLAAADPLGGAYGRWLTRDEVLSLVAPDASVRATVRAWAESTGATCSDFPSSLRCQASAAQTAALVGAATAAFKNLQTGRIVHRVPCGTPVTLPSIFGTDMLFLTGLFDFPAAKSSAHIRASTSVLSAASGDSPRGRRSLRKSRRPLHALGADDAGGIVVLERAATSDAAAAAAAAAVPPAYLFVTVASLEQLYNMHGIRGSAAVTASVAEFGASNSCLSHSDVAAFAAANGLPAWNISTFGPPPLLCSNPDISFNNAGEPELDVQVLGAVGFGSTQAYWTEDMCACERDAQNALARAKMTQGVRALEDHFPKPPPPPQYRDV